MTEKAPSELMHFSLQHLNKYELKIKRRHNIVNPSSNIINSSRKLFITPFQTGREKYIILKDIK